jgi:hypothetical protein
MPPPAPLTPKPSQLPASRPAGSAVPIAPVAAAGASVTTPTSAAGYQGASVQRRAPEAQHESPAASQSSHAHKAVTAATPGASHVSTPAGKVPQSKPGPKKPPGLSIALPAKATKAKQPKKGSALEDGYDSAPPGANSPTGSSKSSFSDQDFILPAGRALQKRNALAAAALATAPKTTQPAKSSPAPILAPMQATLADGPVLAPLAPFQFTPLPVPRSPSPQRSFSRKRPGQPSSQEAAKKPHV